MSAPGYNPNYKAVVPGEPVAAGVVNRQDQTAQGNIAYLKARLDALTAGNAIIIPDQTMTAAVLPGQPVYLDTVNQRFDQALAAVTTDPASGVLIPQATARVRGICFDKTNPTLGDVLLFGKACLPLTNAVSGAVVAGDYYLSSSQPGMLTSPAPPVSVPVLFADGQGSVYVSPMMGDDYLFRHVHYAFQLACRPAGHVVQPSIGNPHTIAVAYPNINGWLPANHAVFNGRAPSGAKFGYNLLADNALNRLWPPIPLQAVSLTWDKGENYVGGTQAPLTGPDPLCIINSDGIWWMSNCYGDVPWPIDFSVHDSSSVSSIAEPPTCPRNEVMSLTLSYARAVFANNQSVVTRLSIADGSPLTLTNCDGLPATVGSLILALSLKFLAQAANLPGYQVFKTFNPTTMLFETGPVVEGLIAGNNITLSGPNQLVNEVPVFQGITTVSATTNALGAELPVQTVRVEDVLERTYNGIDMLAFPSGQDSSLDADIRVPPSGLGSSPTVTLILTLLAEAAGALPALTLSYIQIPRSANAPAVLGNTVLSLAWVIAPSSFTTTQNNQYVEAVSAPISVAPGDLLYVTVTRTGSTDAYTSELGLMYIAPVLGNS